MTEQNTSSYESLQTVCPNCNDSPYLIIEKESPFVNIKCENCGLVKTENLLNYLNFIKNLQNRRGVEENFYSRSAYCEECKKYITESTLKEHQGHTLVNLCSYVSTKEKKEKIIEGNAHISGYCRDLKEKYFVKMNNEIEKLEKKIKEIKNEMENLEKEYQIFKEKNSSVLLLMNVIIKNYEKEKRNYYLLQNFHNLPKICIYKCNGENNYKTIMRYYQLYSITHQPMTIRDVHKIKKIEQDDLLQNIINLKNGKIAMCGYDDKITILDPKNNFEKVLSIPLDNTIYSICQLENEQIVSCCQENLHFWSISDSNYVCVHKIETQHDSTINHVVPLTGNRIASTAYDNTIKIWETIPPYKCLSTLQKHNNTVYSAIQIKGKEILVSGSNDERLCVWSLKTYQLQNIITKVCCSGRNALLQINNNQIIVGGDNVISIVDINSYQILNQIKNSKIDSIYGIKPINEDLFIFGSSNGYIGIYDVKVNIIEIKKYHQEGVLGFAKVDNTFISCSYDKSLQLFDCSL